MEYMNIMDLLEVLAKVMGSTADFCYNTIFYNVNIHILGFGYQGPLWLLITAISTSVLGLGALIRFLILGAR